VCGTTYGTILTRPGGLRFSRVIVFRFVVATFASYASSKQKIRKTKTISEKNLTADYANEKDIESTSDVPGICWLTNEELQALWFLVIGFT